MCTHGKALIDIKLPVTKWAGACSKLSTKVFRNQTSHPVAEISKRCRNLPPSLTLSSGFLLFSQHPAPLPLSPRRNVYPPPLHSIFFARTKRKLREKPSSVRRRSPNGRRRGRNSAVEIIRVKEIRSAAERALNAGGGGELK